MNIFSSYRIPVRGSTGVLYRAAALILLTSTSSIVPAWALDFNFIVPAGTDSKAVAGFEAAGDRWSAIFTDDITVNIEIEFADIPSVTGATILGSTGSEIFEPPPGTTIVPSFPTLKDKLKADAQSANDAVATLNLPDVPFLTALTNTRSGAVVVDDDGSGNNVFFGITTANAKALDLLPANDPAIDGSISFNSTVSFDFDPVDGITPGTTDFIGVATHELGHALGFTTGVDLIDAFSGAGPSAAVDLNGFLFGIGELDPFTIFTTLDLFRRSVDSLAIDPDISDLSTGAEVFFSIDGQSSELLLETGSFNGTGQQASHFLDNLGLGIMDPTAAAGELLQITENDIFVFDVIGYDPLPGQFGVAGDFNSSGAVDGADFLAWQRGESSSPLNPLELAFWEQNFGRSSATSSLMVVPEPEALLMLFVAMSIKLTQSIAGRIYRMSES